MAGLVKAKIEILDAAAVNPPRLPATFQVQFNPTDLLVTKTVEYAQANLPGLDGPLLQFLRGGTETIELELFFDTTDTQQDVQQHTRRLHELVTVQPKLHAPPRFAFEWGSGLRFQAVAVGIKEHFTLFSSSGVPLRAVVQLVMKQYRTLQELLAQQGPRSGRKTGSRRSEAGLHSYTPSAEMRFDGEDEAVRGLLEAKVCDAVEAATRFELVVDNWDDEQRAPRHSSGNTFKLGRQIALQLGYLDGGASRSVVHGVIGKVRQVFARENRPRLLIEGAGSWKARRRKAKSTASTMRLAYGETLLELELLQEGPGASARGVSLGIPDLVVGMRVHLEGLGERLEDTYRVTSTTHCVDTGGYTTTFECKRENRRRTRKP